MKTEEFNQAKDILTEKASFRRVLDDLAIVKTDEVQLRKITISGRKNDKLPEASFNLESYPTNIREKVSIILNDAYVAFEATVAHRLKSEINRLDEEFKNVSCTKG